MTAGKAERNPGQGTGYNQPCTNGERKPSLQNKTTALGGLISAWSAPGSGSWVPREGGAGDVGGGHRQLWLKAGMVYKPFAFAGRAPWEGLWRQLSESEEEE